jgi:orotidine-5'-phosphate decarboxylase
MFEISETTNQKPQIKDKIIVALDVETAAEARETIAELREEVGAFKIGLQLFTSAGASFVRETVENGIEVFLDVKFHDIPNTVAKASIEVARLGVWMFNVHALGGREMLSKTTESVREVCDKENLKQPKIIGVTVLTSSNQETLSETGIEREISAQVLNLARLTAKYGLDGVVASPREIEAIRACIDKKNFLIVTPGIRSPRSETFDDQKRVMSAGEAIKTGSDYLVIGRPILQADDKIEAVREILREIQYIQGAVNH